MLRLINKRKAVKLVIVLIVFITTTSCMTLKTIPVNILSDLKYRSDILHIHSDDSLWIVSPYLIRDKNLTGKLYSKSGSNHNTRVVDVYVAPFDAVKIEGDGLKISTENIGKVDYKILDVPKAIGISASALILFFMLISF